MLPTLFNHWFGMHGIFWFTAGLALLGIIVLTLLVPNPVKRLFHSDSQAIPELFKSVLSNSELLRLNFGIFIQHAILTASFVALPLIVKNNLNINPANIAYIYLLIMIASFAVMVPLVIITEKKRVMKPIFLSAIFTIAIAQVLLATWNTQLFDIVLALFIFFTGFNLLEATLPSLISKIAPAGSKGTAMGIYSSSQFFGIFVGGTLGGWLYGIIGENSVFYACSALALIWLGVASFMQKPKHLSSKIFKLNNTDTVNSTTLKQQLLKVAGVEDVAISLEEGIAYLKIDKQQFDQNALTQFI